jgi:hypothetical protein
MYSVAALMLLISLYFNAAGGDGHLQGMKIGGTVIITKWFLPISTDPGPWSSHEVALRR